MATLTPENFCSVADNGRIVLDIDPTGHGDTELFERTVPFGTTATATTPPWQRVPDVVAPQRHTRTRPLGSLYQARLFPKDAIAAGAQPTEFDRPLGVVDLPCVSLEQRDRTLLTRCLSDRAVMALDVGDTWLGVDLFTGATPTRLLLLVGLEEPAGFGFASWPRFGEHTPVAGAASVGPARLHHLYAPPRTLLPRDEGIDPKSVVHVVAVVWTADGHWDFVWSTEGSGGSGQPLAVTTRTREISARVTRIACFDDSFETDFGVGWRTADAERVVPGRTRPDDVGTPDAVTFDLPGPDAGFDLALSTAPGVALVVESWKWEDPDDGEVALPERFSLEWSGGAEGRAAQIYLGSGSCNGTVDVPLPAGEGVRSTTHHLQVEGRFVDGDLGFAADLVVTVGYS